MLSIVKVFDLVPRAHKREAFKAEENLKDISHDRGVSYTCNTRKRNSEGERGNGRKKKKKIKERKNLQWTTEPPSCRQAGRPFSASRPPLSHGT